MGFEASIAQQTVTPNGVMVHFTAGEWAKLKSLFAGTSADATVQQNIPEDAAVTITVTPDELAAAHAAHSAEPEPESDLAVPPAPGLA
jgi:hypothetical protein